MGKILVAVLALSSLVFASADGGHSTDIVQRTVNFVLFAALLWYLLANPVKSYFANRSKGIADEYESVQNRLNESIEKKKDALAKISNAEKQAVEIIETAKKESKILNDAILEQCESDLVNLEKAQQGKLELAQRRMVASVVEEVLEEIVKDASGELSKDAMVNVILKKVA